MNNYWSGMKNLINLRAGKHFKQPKGKEVRNPGRGSRRRMQGVEGQTLTRREK